MVTRSVPNFPLSLCLTGLRDKSCDSRVGDTEKDKGVCSMARKEILDKLSIYVPQPRWHRSLSSA